MTLAAGPHVATRVAPPAESDSRCAGPEDATVVITLIGPAGRRAAAREVLGELVQDRVSVEWLEVEAAEISASIRQAEADDLALAHVYVDLREAPLLVFIGDRGHVRVLIRRIALPASFDEAAREEVGAIVSSALDALCAGGTIGIVRVQPPTEPAPRLETSTPPIEAPPPPAPRRWGGGVLARYRVMAWGPTRVQHALELGGVLRRRGAHVDAQAIVWAGAIPPGAVTGAPDSPRIGGGLLRAELGAVVPLTSRWSQLVAGGVGVDLLRGAGGRWRPVPIVQAGIGLRAVLGRGFVAEVLAHVAVDLVDTRVLDVADRRVLFDPWRVRPGISLTFGWLSPR